MGSITFQNSVTTWRPNAQTCEPIEDTHSQGPTNGEHGHLEASSEHVLLVSRNVLYARDVVHNVYPQTGKIQKDQTALWRPPLPDLVSPG